jgi:hypothetical protein
MGTSETTGPVRNADLSDLVAILQGEHARKVDVVVPAPALRADGGRLVVAGAEPTITSAGVTLADGVYLPTAVADEGLADKLRIPQAYLRRLRAEHVDLFDANVNGWLGHSSNAGRKLLVRALRDDGGGQGVARAVLSDKYRTIDNLDVLVAALDGVRQAGVEVRIDGCDLTDRKMYVRIRSESVRALAPTLLRDYRSPFTGERGADNPVVWAGFVITNSETGCGAFTITPRLTVQVCSNGLTIAADALRAVHLGGKLDDGVVRWSEDTRHKAVELVTAQARDAVTTFLDVDYVRAQIEGLERTAGVPVADPAAAIQNVAKQLRFTDGQQAQILAHFIRGGDLSAGGVMHAVTAAAQAADADAAHDMEAQAVRAMHLAAGV